MNTGMKSSEEEAGRETDCEIRRTGKDKDRNETCICCHKRVDVSVDQDIEFRPFYIEGAGQLCYDCYQELYGIKAGRERLTKDAVQRRG